MRSTVLRSPGATAPRSSSSSTFSFACFGALAALALGSAPAFAQDGDGGDEGESAAAESAAEATSERIAVRAKRVIVRPGQEITDAVVLVHDGKVIDVGQGVEVPDGFRLIEGEVVCAGFMDPWSIAGLEPGSARTSQSEATARATDIVDPYSQERVLEELLAAGVLMSRSVVGAQAEYGGLSAVLRVAGPEPVHPEAALSASIGGDAGGGSPFGRRQVDPLQGLSQVDDLVDELRDGIEYGKELVEYENELAAWKKEIADKEKELEDDFKKAKRARDKKVEDAKEDGEEVRDKKYREDKRPRAPREDREKAVFARVANGEIPLVVKVDRAREIRDLLQRTAEFPRLRLVLAGGQASLACVEQIVERGVPVIVSPSPADVGGPVGDLDPGLSLAAELDAVGVEVLIGTGASSALASRDLPLLAALAVGHGLDREAALHAITTGPARVFDVSRDAGAIRRGRGAEMIVLSGDPLSSSTRVLAAISGGKVVHEAN